MVMTFLPGSPAQTPVRDDQRRLANAAVLKTYIANMAALIRTTPADDAVNSASLRDVNPALATGRNLIIDGDMELAGTTNWAAISSATLSKQTTTQHGGGSGQVLRVAYNAVTNPAASPPATTSVSGKLYHVTGWYRGDGASCKPRISNAFTAAIVVEGTTSNSWQSFDGYLVSSTGTCAILTAVATSAGYAEFDDVSVTQVGIPASSAFPTTEVLKDGLFKYPLAAWPTATNWTQDGAAGGALHVAGSVTAITQAASLIIGRTYTCVVTVTSRTAGSITPRAGSTGTGGSAITANGAASPQTLTCAGNTTFALVPTTDFDGRVTVSLVPTDGLIVWNGDGSTATGWTAANSATLSSVSGWLRVARNGVNNPVATQSPLKAGSTYHIVVSVRGDGTAIPSVSVAGTLLAGSLSGTSSTSTQAIDFTVLVTAAGLSLLATTSSGTTYAEFQSLAITELAPMIALPVNGVVLGHTSSQALIITDANSDGINDAINEYSADFNSAWTPTLNSLGVFAEVSGSGVWTDATVRYLVRRRADASNEQSIFKSATSNRVSFLYLAGGTSKQIDYTWSGLGMHCYAMTVDKANDLMTAYVDGVVVGTASGLGVWVGNLSSTGVAMGAGASTGTNSWSGFVSNDFDCNAALAPDIIMTIAQLGGAA